MPRNYIKTDAFVASAYPIIIKAKPGRLSYLYDTYKPYALNASLNNTGLKSLLSPSQQLSVFSTMSSFNYMTGLFSGLDIENIAHDSNVEAVWPDRVDKRILSYPLSQPYPIASSDKTYTADTHVKNQAINFTSLQEVAHLIGADTANAEGYTGNGITAVVSDTGGHRTNPMTPGLIKQTAIPGIYTDENSHGEWTASAIGGRKSVDYTFSSMNRGKSQVINIGMAPGVKLIEIKALGFVIGTGSDSMLLKSIDMALADKCDILSCSWGGTPTHSNPQDSVFYDAMQAIKNSGAIPVIAAGNSGPDHSTIGSPGDLPNVLTVGSYNAVSNEKSMFGQAGYVSGFSSRGPTLDGEIKPDTVAPGAIIDGAIGPVLDLSYTHVVHSFQAIAGTSMATPIVAGLLCLMKQAHKKLLGKNLAEDEVKTMLSELGHLDIMI